MSPFSLLHTIVYFLASNESDENLKSSSSNDFSGVNDLNQRIEKLDGFQEDMEKTQDRIRDKVERQIPQDVSRFHL